MFGSMKQKKKCRFAKNKLKMRILSFIILLAPLFVISQTTLFFENFNNGLPYGWQMIDNDHNTPNASPSVNFITGAYVTHEDYDSTGIGDSVMVATSWFTTPGVADDYLITPAITLGSNGNKLIFEAKSVDGSYPDGLQVLYSTGDLNSWTFIANDTLFEEFAISNNWTSFTVSLDTLLTNQTVYFAFRHVAYDEFILCLDNIKVETNNFTSISENNKEQLRLYPNPSQGQIRLNTTEKTSYEIYSLIGEKLQSGTTNGIIDLNLSSGIYFIKVNNQTMKFELVR